MNCKYCGATLSGNDKFCQVCGKKAGEEPTVAGGSSVPSVSASGFGGKTPKAAKKAKVGALDAEPKKKSKKKLILAVIILVLAAALCTAGYLFVKKITDPSDKIIKYLTSGEYEEAYSVYKDKFKYGDREDEDVLVGKIKERVATLTDDFLNEKIEYGAVSKEIGEIKKFEIDSLTDYISEAATRIEEINQSHVAYHKGEDYYDSGDFKNALAQLEAVIEDDVNYDASTELVDKAISEYKAEVIADAKELSEGGAYEKAISKIDDALKTLEGDSELKDLRKTYIEQNKNMIADEAIAKAKSYADAGNLEGAVTEISDALDKVGDDNRLTIEFNNYSKKYKDAVLAEADALVAARNHSEAINKLNDAIELLPKETSLKDKLAKVTAVKPVVLSTLTTFNGGWTWGGGDPTDPFGNSFAGAKCYATFGGSTNVSSEYRISGKYRRITGTLAPQKDMPEGRTAKISIYSGDAQLYSSPEITRKTEPFYFDVDISGVEYLKVQINTSYSGAVIISDFILWVE